MKGLKILTTFIILSVITLLISCNNDDDNADYPLLKVINETSIAHPRYKVSLVGYEFESLAIEPNGDSQTFKLEHGMPSGYENIEVIVQYSSRGTIWRKSKKVNFANGRTSTITLKGCFAEGCDDITIE